MSFIRANEQGKQVLVLPAILDLTVGQAVKEDLQAALAKGEGLEIDASQVQRATSPSLQILAAGARAFAETGGPALCFVNASENFRETVFGLALDAVLGLEEKGQ